MPEKNIYTDKPPICPPCKEGDHIHHQWDYLTVNYEVRICRCPKCYKEKE